MQSVCCCHLLPFLIGNSMQSVCCCHPLPFLIGNTHQCVWGGVGGVWGGIAIALAHLVRVGLLDLRHLLRDLALCRDEVRRGACESRRTLDPMAATTRGATILNEMRGRCPQILPCPPHPASPPPPSSCPCTTPCHQTPVHARRPALYKCIWRVSGSDI